MKQYGKIIKMNPGHCVGGYVLMLIHQKNNPLEYHEKKYDFVKDQAYSFKALMRAKRN